MVEASVKQNRQITQGAFSKQSKRRLQCWGKKLCKQEFVNQTWCHCGLSQKPRWLKKYQKRHHPRSSPEIPYNTLNQSKLDCSKTNQQPHLPVGNAAGGQWHTCAILRLFKVMSNPCGCIRRNPMKDEWRHRALGNECSLAFCVEPHYCLERQDFPLRAVFWRTLLL